MAMYRQPGVDWRQCMQAQVSLPYGYYVGMTAETGGISDYHEVEYFEFYEYLILPSMMSLLPTDPVLVLPRRKGKRNFRIIIAPRT